MARKTTSLRLEEELLEWAQHYADERGVSRTAVFEAGLKGLRKDARGGVVDLPEPEAVPSPEQTGTDGWREPTAAELRSARERYPDLPPAQLRRLARAEAHMADAGLPQVKVKMSREVTRAAGGPGGGDFARITQARGDLFAHLHTPDSVTGKVSTKSAYRRS